MGDYGFLITLGVVALIATIIGFWLRWKDKSKKSRKKGRGKNGKDKFYKPDAYQDMGGDGGDFEDSDLYAMKEGKSRSRGFKDNSKKKKEEFESWEDY